MLIQNLIQEKEIWRITSRYAEVICLQTEKGLVVKKIIAPGVVNKDNAQWVNDVSFYFREQLKKLAVPLSEPYLFEKHEGSAIQTSPFVGMDLENIIKSGLMNGGYGVSAPYPFNNFNLASIFSTPHLEEVNIKLMKGLISSIKGVLLQNFFDVGIDGRLSNFCLGADGIVYYVDTFPPLVKYKGNYVVHFPNPTNKEILEQEIRRKFEPLGILRRLRFSILEQDVNGLNEDLLVHSVNSVMGNTFSNKVRSFFETLPDNQNIDEVINDITLSDPDSIREIALKKMPPRGDERDFFLKEIFDLSSNYCPYNITISERLFKIKKILNSNV